MLSGEARYVKKEVAKSFAVVVGQQCGAVASKLPSYSLLVHLAKCLHYGLSWLGHDTRVPSAMEYGKLPLSCHCDLHIVSWPDWLLILTLSFRLQCASLLNEMPLHHFYYC